MKSDNAQLLLKDYENQQLLKQLILEKAQLYDKVSALMISDEDIDELLKGIITADVIRVTLNNYLAKAELVTIRRDLTAMCYQLNDARNRIPKRTKWKEAYDYATSTVQIGDVVTGLTGITNFNKNIHCPFHEDKDPSMKIYTKNNRFVCFSCNSRGSPIDFVKKHKDYSFQEAVLYLSNI